MKVYLLKSIYEDDCDYDRTEHVEGVFSSLSAILNYTKSKFKCVNNPLLEYAQVGNQWYFNGVFLDEFDDEVELYFESYDLIGEHDVTTGLLKV